MAEEQQKTLDSRALEIAVESRTMILSHIKECTMFREEMVRRFDDGKEDRKQLRTQFEAMVVANRADNVATANQVNSSIVSFLKWGGGTLLGITAFLLITYVIPVLHK